MDPFLRPLSPARPWERASVGRARGWVEALRSGAKPGELFEALGRPESADLFAEIVEGLIHEGAGKVVAEILAADLPGTSQVVRSILEQWGPRSEGTALRDCLSSINPGVLSEAIRSQDAKRMWEVLSPDPPLPALLPSLPWLLRHVGRYDEAVVCKILLASAATDSGLALARESSRQILASSASKDALVRALFSANWELATSLTAGFWTDEVLHRRMDPSSPAAAVGVSSPAQVEHLVREVWRQLQTIVGSRKRQRDKDMLRGVFDCGLMVAEACARNRGDLLRCLETLGACSSRLQPVSACWCAGALAQGPWHSLELTRRLVACLPTVDSSAKPLVVGAFDTLTRGTTASPLLCSTVGLQRSLRAALLAAVPSGSLGAVSLILRHSRATEHSFLCGEAMSVALSSSCCADMVGRTLPDVPPSAMLWMLLHLARVLNSVMEPALVRSLSKREKATLVLLGRGFAQDLRSRVQHSPSDAPELDVTGIADELDALDPSAGSMMNAPRSELVPGCLLSPGKGVDILHTVLPLLIPTASHIPPLATWIDAVGLCLRKRPSSLSLLAAAASLSMGCLLLPLLEALSQRVWSNADPRPSHHTPLKEEVESLGALIQATLSVLRLCTGKDPAPQLQAAVALLLTGQLSCRTAALVARAAMYLATLCVELSAGSLGPDDLSMLLNEAERRALDAMCVHRMLGCVLTK
jgi:hypothetical protein